MISNEEIQRIVISITEGLEEQTGKGWSLNEAATSCVFWCVLHKAWRDGAGLGMTKIAAIEQLRKGPLSRRSKGAIEAKVMNVTSVAQILLEKGMPIYNEGRYIKRGTGEDMGPMVCKGYAPASNSQACLLDILPKALFHFDLLTNEFVSEDISSTHGGNKKRSWVSANLPEKIDRKSVIEAINRIESDGIAPHGKNHTFELLHDGKGYPPLAVLAFALEHQQGEVVQAGSLRPGENSVEFKLMRDAGFSISKIYSEGHTEDEIQQKAQSARGKPVNENAGSDCPAKYAAEVTNYERDQNVVHAVLHRADGVCEGCGQESGFKRKSTGQPYLEVHNIQFLSNDGPDRAWNAVALCPNCHKRCHYADDCEAFNELLYEKVDAVRRSDPSEI